MGALFLSALEQEDQPGSDDDSEGHALDDGGWLIANGGDWSSKLKEPRDLGLFSKAGRLHTDRMPSSNQDNLFPIIPTQHALATRLLPSSLW